MNALIAHLRTDSLEGVAEVISEDTEPDASIVEDGRNFVLRMGNQGSTLEFPMTAEDFWEQVQDLEDDVVGQWGADTEPTED
ncbi:unannotated protein [freshwater metagenome]|uniref:Unannotated protein n=1 Tax=freshwater metagenome TaxID=449393 RepID=A0A6J7HST2_9ZZZZ